MKAWCKGVDISSIANFAAGVVAKTTSAIFWVGKLSLIADEPV